MKKTILLLSLFIGFLLCLCMIVSDLAVKEESRQMYDALRKQVQQEVGVAGTGMDTAAQTEEGAPCPIDFEKLQEVNPHATAWLTQEETVINYPVVQGKDNIYYLKHDVSGQGNALGTFFLNYENAPDFSDQNSTIFGHHLNNGMMMGTLANYRKQGYYPQHPTMMLYTPKTTYRVELFAGYITTDFSVAYCCRFSSQAEWMDYIQHAREKSTFVSEVEVGAEDRIVTLSTCTSESSSDRYLVLGKLVPIGGRTDEPDVSDGGTQP